MNDCNLSPKYDLCPRTDINLLSFLVNLSFHCALLLLFMPFMPRKGEEATEFQTYALARCVYACKDHIDFTAKYQYPIPPSHYLFNITQHLLVAGALLLLICHRGLQDPKLLDRTIKDVDACIGVLKLIGQRFVGGTIGAEMVQNMKENMKHSETWKTRQQKIAEAAAAEAAGVNKNQGPLFPPMPLPGPRRMPGIMQPNTSSKDVSPGTRSSPSHRSTLQTLQEDPGVSPPRGSAESIGLGLAQNDINGRSGMVLLGNTAAMASTSSGMPSHFPGNLMMPNYNAHEPGYLYPTQPSNNQYGTADPQMSQMPMQAYTPNNGTSSFLEDYLQMAGANYSGYPGYGTPSAMQTYNTPDQQPLWPSDNLNFNIKDLEEITARSYNSSFMNNNGFPSNSSQYPFFQF